MAQVIAAPRCAASEPRLGVPDVGIHRADPNVSPEMRELATSMAVYCQHRPWAALNYLPHLSHWDWVPVENPMVSPRRRGSAEYRATA